MGKDITILADTSLTVPLSLIVRQYVRATSVPITTAFANTKEQVDQIKQGGEADLFISAKPAWIASLQQQGLIDVYSRTSITGNRLELIAANPAPMQLEPEHLNRFFEKQDADYRFIMADPEYLAEGTYTLEALRKMKLLREIEPHLTLMDNIGLIKDSVAKYAAFSVIFKTDAMLDPTTTSLLTLPGDSHSPVIYEAVVVVGDNMDGAREFLKYLQSDAAKNTFKQYGFVNVE